MTKPTPQHALDFAVLQELYSPRLVSLVEAALAYPESSLEAPWDFPLVKTGGKILCMLNEDANGLRFTCKLRESHTQVIERPDITPTGHGLGKHGWINQLTPHGEALDTETLIAWMEESFRLVAPKRLIKAWDARHT